MIRNFLLSFFVLTCLLTASYVPSHADAPASFHVVDGVIQLGGKPVTLRGVNAMHIFGGDSSDLLDWKGIGIVREFVGNLRDAPLTSGAAFHDETNHNWLHSVQDIVSKNTQNGVVTVLCPFGWDGTHDTVFSGAVPSKTTYYADYKKQMRAWAAQFKTQPYVWIELWNEPFEKLSSASDDAVWLADMEDMVDNLRSAGWHGVIVVPGSCWGQDETVVERVGGQLTANRPDIVFDIHAYEQWLRKPQTIGTRMAVLRANHIPVIFGEVGPHNNANVLDAAPFLAAAQANGNPPVLAWIWSRNEKEPNSLRSGDGAPNNNNNFNWGSIYRSYLAPG